jgi:hypothetical protein
MPGAYVLPGRSKADAGTGSPGAAIAPAPAAKTASDGEPALPVELGAAAGMHEKDKAQTLPDQPGSGVADLRQASPGGAATQEADAGVPEGGNQAPPAGNLGYRITLRRASLTPSSPASGDFRFGVGIQYQRPAGKTDGPFIIVGFHEGVSCHAAAKLIKRSYTLSLTRHIIEPKTLGLQQPLTVLL